MMRRCGGNFRWQAPTEATGGLWPRRGSERILAARAHRISEPPFASLVRACAVANAPKVEVPILSGPYWGAPQTVDKAPGDIGGEAWTRYDDPAVKAFKLNAERNNGRAAMLGITGCLIHELLGVDALYPTGGLDGAAPPAIFS